MSIRTYQLTVTSGTPVRLADEAIESGLPVVVKALAGNAGDVTIGGNAAEAAFDSDANFPLKAGEGVSIRIRSTDDIWVDGTTSGDKVAFLVEDNG
jgi:hypothetical protein